MAVEGPRRASEVDLLDGVDGSVKPDVRQGNAFEKR
jgi:hypothetical protein